MLRMALLFLTASPGAEQQLEQMGSQIAALKAAGRSATLLRSRGQVKP